MQGPGAGGCYTTVKAGTTGAFSAYVKILVCHTHLPLLIFIKSCRKGCISKGNEFYIASMKLLSAEGKESITYLSKEL